MKKKSIVALAVLTVIFTCYVNCGRAGFSARKGLAGVDSLASEACEDILRSTYSDTYFPLLSSPNSCNRCHGNAHGSTDFNISYAAFMDYGVELIDSRATAPHGGNGLNLTNEINAIKPNWNLGENEYFACIAAQTIATTTTTTTTMALPTTPTTMPPVTATTQPQTVTTTTMPPVVTFTQLVSTDPVLGVFRNSCFNCHSGTRPSAGINLSDYNTARSRASLILSQIRGGSMPPGSRLQQAQIDAVTRWVNGGTPQ